MKSSWRISEWLKSGLRNGCVSQLIGVELVDVFIVSRRRDFQHLHSSDEIVG